MSAATPPIVIMGVQGSGKSTLGTLLALRLGVEFIDGDRLHPAENVAIMAAGRALTDAERIPWLREVSRMLARKQHEGIVIACSALKRDYRDQLRAAAPGLFIVHPQGAIEVVSARIGLRRHEFMPAGLLQSQFDALEPLEADEYGMAVDITRWPAQIIDAVAAVLEGAPC